MMPFEKQPPLPLDIVSQGLLSQTPLHYACYKGEVQMIDSLLGKTSSYNSNEQAARACIRAMIEEEDAINGWTPAHWAAFYGQLACLMRLHIRPSFGFDKSTERSNTSPLHLAAQSGAILCLKWLLQCGAAINRQDFMGETALHKAAKAGNTDSAAMLMSHGSALELKNHRGCTPADLAELANHPTLAQLLRRYCEQPNHSDTARVPQPYPLPISDLNVSSTPFPQTINSAFARIASLVGDCPSAFSHCEESKSSGSIDGSGSISMNGEDIHHHSSLSCVRPDFNMSSESLSSGSGENGSAGLSSLCRMKRSIDLMDNDEEEEMVDADEIVHPDTKRRCFVSSQGQTQVEKYGDTYNNNVISSYNAVLAMRVDPLRNQFEPEQGRSEYLPPPCPSSSVMEHQETVVAEQGYDRSRLSAFNNVFF